MFLDVIVSLQLERIKVSQLVVQIEIGQSVKDLRSLGVKETGRKGVRESLGVWKMGKQETGSH